MERIRYAAEWLSFNSTSFEIAKGDGEGMGADI